MKNHIGLAFLYLLAGLWVNTAALAEQVQPKSIAEQVAAAIVDVRQGNLTLARALDAKQAFPYLKKYATDPNDNVQMIVVDAAAGTQTGEAVQVLARMVADQSVNTSGRAVDALYNNFDKSSLRQNGGEELKSNLLLCLKRERRYEDNEIVLLLSCFPKDANILRALMALRQNFISQSTKEPSSAPSYLAQALPVDLALSELGQTDAAARVQGVIKQGDVTLLPVLLMNLKFVDSPTILKSLVPLLRDKRFTRSGLTITGYPNLLLIPRGQDPKEYQRTHPLPPPPLPRTVYWRVCDIALLRLAQKTGIDIGVPAVVSAVRDHNTQILPQNYTDAELDIAYARLSAYFGIKTPAKS